MNLSNIDLNLMYVLKHLLEEKHVSNTALTLNMSQPTVSRALQKLRAIFSDDLLVRTGYGYDLTPKALAIQQDLNTMLASLEKLISGEQFSPEQSTATIRFFGLVPQISQFMPQVVKAIRKQAPQVVVDLDTVPKRHFQPLINGDVHFVLSTHQPQTSEQNLYRMFIASRDFRLLMSDTHPLANKEITVDNLLDCHFGQISLSGDKRLSIEQRFRDLGMLSKDQRLSVPVQLANFNIAPDIAEATDTVFHLPTPFAEQACLKRNLVCKPVPEALRSPSKDVYLYWHKRFHNDPMCQWIRQIFSEIYQPL